MWSNCVVPKAFNFECMRFMMEHESIPNWAQFSILRTGLNISSVLNILIPIISQFYTSVLFSLDTVLHIGCFTFAFIHFLYISSIFIRFLSLQWITRFVLSSFFSILLPFLDHLGLQSKTIASIICWFESIVYNFLKNGVFLSGMVLDVGITFSVPVVALLELLVQQRHWRWRILWQALPLFFPLGPVRRPKQLWAFLNPAIQSYTLLLLVSLRVSGNANGAQNARILFQCWHVQLGHLIDLCRLHKSGHQC